MDQYLENLKEINFKFQKTMAALPGITKQDREIVKHDGVEFYTNEKLRQKFIMSLMKHTPVKSHDTISKLVNKKTLIPAFLTKSTFDWYKKNAFDPDQDNVMSGVLGFYLPKTGKIFVLIDAGYKVLGWVPDSHLAAVTLHECMHMAAKVDPKKFMRVNVKAFHQYYSEFLEFVFEAKGTNQKELLDWIMYIHQFETSNRNASFKSQDYMGKMAKAIEGKTKLTPDEIKQRTIYTWNYLVGTYGAHGSKLISTVRKYVNIYKALHVSYRRAFGFVARTLPYQELFTSSEVICILASMELGKSKYVSDSLDIIL